jgi:hypothetical protein
MHRCVKASKILTRVRVPGTRGGSPLVKHRGRTPGYSRLYNQAPECIISRVKTCPSCKHRLEGGMTSWPNSLPICCSPVLEPS